MQAEIEVSRVFKPLLAASRYKGAWGGRGSGKSHFFALLCILYAQQKPGIRIVCIREVQKSLKESVKRLIEDKLQDLGLGEEQGFKVTREWIETPGNGIIIFQGMQDHTAESIKSLEGFSVAWAEEAQTLSATSLKLLRPTIRATGSEIWFTWNPRRKTDPVDKFLRGGELPSDAIVIKANWSDNSFLPSELNQERLDDLRIDPEGYEHVWEGGYIIVSSGAYYAKVLQQARVEKRIGRVGLDPLMTLRAFWDIGGTGAKADACAIWIGQFIGKEIRVIDYYEAVGQELSEHINWLRVNGYGKAYCILPHDGAQHDSVYRVSYESSLKQAGFAVQVIPRMNGAVAARIEAVRRVFPNCWFDEVRCAAGLEALGWYHEKKDDVRNIGLGAEHDWSSHACFTGYTKVITKNGLCEIMNLSFTGEVLTSCGWKQYIAPRMTKKNVQLVQVEFADGYIVKCTPDHLFKTVNGWKSAEHLTMDSLILSILTPSPNILMVDFIENSQVRGITLAEGKNYIERHGLKLLVKFLKAVTSIIKTAIQIIIVFLIWNVLMLKNMKNIQIISRVVKHLQMKLEKKQPNGISLKREDYGIQDMLPGLKVGLNGSGKKSHALFVDYCLIVWSESQVTLKFIVQTLAKLQPINKGIQIIEKIGIVNFVEKCLARWSEKQMLKNIALPHVGKKPIKSVKKIQERSDVWCLTVPSVNEFALENGAIVHNCDAFGLMALSYDRLQERATATKRPKNNSPAIADKVAGY